MEMKNIFITPIMSDLDVNQRIIKDMENIIESNWMRAT